MNFCTICQDSKHEKIEATYKSDWPEKGKDATMYYCNNHAMEWMKNYPQVTLTKIVTNPKSLIPP